MNSLVTIPSSPLRLSIRVYFDLEEKNIINENKIMLH